MTPPEVHEILEDTFGSRRIFVTGHTGLKGSWLCLWLNQLGAEVTGYALEPPTTPNLFEAIGLREKISHIHGGVREALSLSIDWYRRFYEQAAPAELYRLTESQIAAYLAGGGAPGCASQLGTGIL
jgi:hypothetical protein